MKKIRRISISIRGFTITQTMVSLLATSAMGVGMVNYLKKNNTNLRSSDMTEELRNAGQNAQLALTDDLTQVTFINPPCTNNAPTGVTPTIACASVKVRAGITPLPGKHKDNVSSMTDFQLPSNINYPANSITEINDSVRLVLYDFAQSFNCRLSARHGTANPSATVESLWVDPNCDLKLTIGKIYVLVQSWSSTTAYASVFQVTGLGTLQAMAGTGYQGLAGPTQEIQVDIASSNNRFNQVGGLGISGFTSEARIFPAKLVEWSVKTDGGLYRREVKPGTADTTGFQSWKLVQKQVESFHILPVTVTTAGATEHNRSMTFCTSADTDFANCDGPEDIRGVNAHIIFKSSRATNDERTFTNAMQTSSTADKYPRLETKFFVAMRNFN